MSINVSEQEVKRIVQKVISGINVETGSSNEKQMGLFDTMEEAIAAAKTAQKIMQKMSMDSREKIIRNIRRMTKEQAETYAKMAVEETGMGNVGDKIGSIIFFVGLPPRNVLICYATLDRMEKQCCSFITDGEELKNNLLFLRQAT